MTFLIKRGIGKNANAFKRFPNAFKRFPNAFERVLVCFPFSPGRSLPVTTVRRERGRTVKSRQNRLTQSKTKKHKTSRERVRLSCHPNPERWYMYVTCHMTKHRSTHCTHMRTPSRGTTDEVEHERDRYRGSSVTLEKKNERVNNAGLRKFS